MDAMLQMKVTQMKQVKIKDNQYEKKESFSEVASIVKRVADKTLGNLQNEGIFVFPECMNDAKDITREQFILQSYNDKYCTGNVMGFLGMGSERIVIESRFSVGDKDYFFQYLLEKVLDYPNFVNLCTDMNQDDMVYHLLLFLFPYYLKSAMRKGPFKTYICKKYNDRNINGVIDIARHIRLNTPFIGNVSYNQREYSFDNYLMELIRHTIEYIKGKSYGYALLKNVKDEVKLIVESTQGYCASERRTIIEENKKNKPSHAYYHEYRSLQKLCIMILQNQKHRFGLGNRRIYGILFDGAWLWEEYINTLIGEQFYHPMNKAGKDKQWLFAGNNGLIYPDFIGKDDENRVIADAKYKPMGNIGNQDYLQVLAYMFRFDAKRAFYFYPEASGQNDKELWLNKGSSFEGNVSTRDDVCLIKHGLRIPRDARDYQDFEQQIGMSEISFLKIL